MIGITFAISLAIASFISIYPAFGEENLRSLLGEWTGQFICDRLPRSATFILRDENDGRLNGEFSFGELNKTGKTIGRFAVSVRELPTGEFRLSPGKWLKRATGYPSLAFVVRRSSDGKRLSGVVDNVRCGAINLTYARPADLARSNLPAMPEPAPKVATRRQDERAKPQTDKCDALPTPGERLDCANTIRYTTPSSSARRPGRFAGRELIEVCGLAYQSIDPVKAPECYSGLAAIGRWKTTVTDFARQHPTCEVFANELRKIIDDNFLLKSWKAYPALDCANVDKIFLARGMGSDKSCVRNRADRVQELAGCTGHPEGTPAFRKAWMEALAQCRAGRQISLYAAIKAQRSERRINDLFEFDCADVIEVVSRFNLATAEQLAAARADIAASQATRPPRENDLIAALKANFSSRFRCYDNADRKMPEEFFRCTLTGAMTPQEMKEMDTIEEILKKTFGGGTERFLTPPTVRLSLNGVVMHGCVGVRDGFSCTYEVEIGCRVNVVSEVREIDLPLSTLVAPSWCGSFAGRLMHSDVLRRLNDKFEIVEAR